ncbi:MAG: VTT domain-containing protein [Candidatus Taylorbacteria bacterium]|nr:VTT domain-containing protein [Candidatus Taylorbacteria bacterium]
MLKIIDPTFIIQTAGALGVILIVFAESGLFFGFFLPGDSLLFTAALFASQGYLNIWILYVGCLVAAIVGDSVGYSFGKKIGPALFTKEDSLFFNKKHIARAQHFYEVHGKKTIIIARFIPIVRTFAPIVAGIGNMKYRTFLSYNVIGGFIWVTGFLGLGYVLGATVPGIDKYLHYIVLGIIVLSFIPPVIHVLKERKM